MRKKSLDELRILAALEEQRQQALEEQRLQKIVQEWTEKRNLADDADYYRHTFQVAPHRRAISESYVNYDREFHTRELNPKFLMMMAEHLDFATPDIRKQNYGRNGLISLGFGVEGKVPIYGVWPAAKQLTKKEKLAIINAEKDVGNAIAQIDLLAKWRTDPYGFEDEKTQKRCYEAVEQLWKGPHAVKVEKKDIPPKTWVFPYFGYYCIDVSPISSLFHCSFSISLPLILQTRPEV